MYWAELVLGDIRTQMGSVFIIFHALFGASVPSLFFPSPAVTWHHPQSPCRCCAVVCLDPSFLRSLFKLVV